MSAILQVSLLARLLHNLRMPRKDLDRLQAKRLRHIVRHAYNNIPFYHRKMRAAGVHPSMIGGPEDLLRLPFTTKEELLNTPLKDLIPAYLDLSTCVRSRTSGSTGTNMTVVYDRQSYAYERALTYRCNISSGVRVNDLVLAITSPSAARLRPSWFQRMGFFRKINLSVLEPPTSALNVISRFHPDVISGYSTALWVLAMSLRSSNNGIRPPRLIMTTAEVLDSRMRSDISEAFHAPVLDQFGCVEMGRTAFECPTHTGYHMNIDSFVFEFLRDGEPISHGEAGEIVYTNLYNYSMPLIRYAVGDIAIPTDEQCVCDRTLPLLKAILGRCDDMITCPNGAFVSPIVLALIMKYRTDVREYRVIQEDRKTLRIQVVPNTGFSEASELEIIRDVQTGVSSDLDVTIERVSTIERNKGGKMRSVISRVPFSWSLCSASGLHTN